MIRNRNKNQRGFSVLFASLIGSLVLAIGFAILSITLKQITLASAGRESQKAFYAADTGTEFALYLDNGGGNPDPICSQGIFPAPTNPEPAEYTICGTGVGGFEYKFDGIILNDEGEENENFKVDDESSDSDSVVSVVKVKRDNAIGNPTCFDLYITKTSEDGGVTVETEIESRGYSTCDESIDTRFERAIRTNN